jgi:hypothetical protein
VFRTCSRRANCRSQVVLKKLADQFWGCMLCILFATTKKVLFTCVHCTTWPVFARKPLVVPRTTGYKTSLYDKYDDFDFAIVNFPFNVVTYHFLLLMVCTSPSWFDTQSWACLAYQAFFKLGKLVTKKLMWQSYNESRLKSSFRTFYACYNDLVCDYKFSLAHMLNDLFHTIC